MGRRLLKSKMALYDDTQRTLSEYLEITKSTFSNKFNRRNGADFNRDEIEKMIGRYHLTGEEVLAIFFDLYSKSNNQG
jgi:hypothetical protein